MQDGCGLCAEGSVSVNELLCYVQNFYMRLKRNELCANIVSFYTTEEVVNAKNSLFTATSGLQIDDMPRQVNRKAGENKRRLDTEDLLTLYSVLDVNKIVLPRYTALDLSRVPTTATSTSPVQFNTKMLETAVDDLHNQMESMKLQLNA